MGGDIQLEVQMEDTIKSIKQRLEEIEGIPILQQRLMVGDVIEDENKTISGIFFKNRKEGIILDNFLHAFYHYIFYCIPLLDN